MTFDELEMICAVNDYANYAEAADYINSSPAVISKHIIKVEQELGIQLFERAAKNKPVVATPEGQKLMVNFRMLLHQYQELLNKCNSLRRKPERRMVVGYLPTIGGTWENEALVRFMLEQPDLLIARKPCTTTGLINGLLDRSLDGIFLSMIEENDFYESIYSKLNDENIRIDYMYSHSNIMLGVSENHPLASEAVIKTDHAALLQDEVFFFQSGSSDSTKKIQRQNIGSLLQLEKPLHARYLDFTEESIVCRLVELGEGVLPLITKFPPRGYKIKFIPIENGVKQISCYFISRTDNALKELKAFRDSLKYFR